jgi:lipopolysaccharide transport system ATP-binding protein
MKPAIQVKGLSKRYHIGGFQGGAYYRTLRESLSGAFAAPLRGLRRLRDRFAATENGKAAPLPPDSIWALKDIEFEVEPGEVLGIIGRNGAGKSTLLKILSRITEPTYGRVEMRGRIASLLEVGTGFHPELTGRENIFLNGAILNMSRREIRRKFDQIVAFSEIEQFLDMPVKRYSSGMYVRLAFAVAAHLEPEILLVDEVLAVGDMEFQKKCLGALREVGRTGRTVFFVSHNLAALQILCKRGLVLRAGKTVCDAPMDVAAATYLKMLGQTAPKQLAERKDRSGLGRVRVEQIEISNDVDGVFDVVILGRPARFVFHLSRYLPGLSCVFTIVDQYGQSLAKFNNQLSSGDDVVEGSEGGARVVCEIGEWLLAAGNYRVNVAIMVNGHLQDYLEGAAAFDAERGPIRGREAPRSDNDWKVAMPHRWLVSGQ